MLQAIRTSRFKKDLKRLTKRGKNIGKLKPVIIALVNEKPLKKQYRDHPLLGNYVGRRECHIEPNWLLIYKLTEIAVILERSGTHADLFKL